MNLCRQMVSLGLKELIKSCSQSKWKHAIIHVVPKVIKLKLSIWTKNT